MPFTSSKLDLETHRTHFVYIIPSDKTNVAEQAIEDTALHLQAWYQWQMGNAKTFLLNNPIVEVYTSTHNAAYFPTNDAGSEFRWWFWDNTIRDANALAGAAFGTEFDDWAIYVDATVATGQQIGGVNVGHCGMCVLSGKDIASIRGVDPDWSQCRGIGGSGHEVGHSWGLVHPPTGHPQWPTAIMGNGYQRYSDALLREDDKQLLDANPFFVRQPRLRAPINLCPFNEGRRRPEPRPRPR